jgi:hypothetical protein
MSLLLIFFGLSDLSGGQKCPIFFSDNLWYGQTFNIKNKGNNKKTHLVSDIYVNHRCHITFYGFFREISLTINNILLTHSKFIIQFCQTRARTSNLRTSPSRASTPQNRFLKRNQFRCGIDSWRHRFHVKELKISEWLCHVL